MLLCLHRVLLHRVRGLTLPPRDANTFSSVSLPCAAVWRRDEWQISRLFGSSSLAVCGCLATEAAAGKANTNFCQSNLVMRASALIDKPSTSFQSTRDSKDKESRHALSNLLGQAPAPTNPLHSKAPSYTAILHRRRCWLAEAMVTGPAVYA